MRGKRTDRRHQGRRSGSGRRLPSPDVGRSSHYFSPSPDVTSRPSTVRLDLPDLSLTLRTDRGVFSGTRIDPGTKYLLTAAPTPPSAGHLADIGCGYGAIALAMATRSPGATVWAVDVNERALELTAANAAAAGLTNVRVATPDAVPDVHRRGPAPDRRDPGDRPGSVRARLRRLLHG